MRATAGAFLKSRWVTAPDGVEELDSAQLAPGFRAMGVPCGLKGGGKTDVGVLVCDADEVRSALALTRNAAAAAPVRVCRDRCDPGAIRAVAVNSGNANAATGKRGYQDALGMQMALLENLESISTFPRVRVDGVAVAETGVIGVALDIAAVVGGIQEAVESLSDQGGVDFARAIMTTDKGPKQCTLRCDGVTVSAQAKGAGMIQPGFATMLCFVQTDAVVDDPDAVLRDALADSMERITVDGQMSTNDTVVLQATGAAGKPLPDGLLDAVLLQLALEIVADGEGASRVGRVEVRQARDEEEAECVARAIANSPLVKTALFGRDSNWGRIAQAAGMALAGEELDELGPDRIEASELAGDGDEVNLSVALGRGDATSHIYFSDLTHDYIRINAEYTS